MEINCIGPLDRVTEDDNEAVLALAKFRIIEDEHFIRCEGRLPGKLATVHVIAL
jgi:hypothetical protein